MSKNIPKKKRPYVKKNKPDTSNTDINSSSMLSNVTENRLYPIVIPPIHILEETNIKKKIDTPLCPKPKPTIESPQWPTIEPTEKYTEESMDKLIAEPTEEFMDKPTEESMDKPITEPTEELKNYNDYLYYGIKLCTIISIATLTYIYIKKRV